MTTKLATFRVDIQTWDEFQAFARRQGESASALLIRFIESSLDGSEGDSHIDNIDSIDEKIKDAVAAKIDWINSTIMDDLNGIRATLTNLGERIDSLDKRVNDVDTLDTLDSPAINSDKIAFCLRQIESMKIVNPDPKENDINTIRRRKNPTGKDLPRGLAVALLKRFQYREDAWQEFLSWSS